MSPRIGGTHPWISMDSMDIHRRIHGYPWNPWTSMDSMDIHRFHGYPWIPRIYMDMHGYMWIPWILQIFSLNAIAISSSVGCRLIFNDVFSSMSVHLGSSPTRPSQTHRRIQIEVKPNETTYSQDSPMKR